MNPLRLLIPIAGLAAALAASAAPEPGAPLPKITGISHLAVYTSHPEAAERFYLQELGGMRTGDPENPAGVVYRYGDTQYVEVLPLPAKAGINRLDHIAFVTESAPALHDALASHGYRDLDPVETEQDGTRHFFSRDPEGNRVEFVEHSRQPDRLTGTPVSTHIIHVGFLVKNRAAEDRFYRDLLGFKPYWYGAMQPGKVDWVSQQVPDGHDWLEYMMTGPGSDTPDPAKVDARQLGVLNHASFGVKNMESAVTRLYAAKTIEDSPRHDGPQMGKDGKWQANLYDPDGTRIELMEFQPVIEPCCSPFTAASPAE